MPRLSWNRDFAYALNNVSTNTSKALLQRVAVTLNVQNIVLSIYFAFMLNRIKLTNLLDKNGTTCLPCVSVVTYIPLNSETEKCWRDFSCPDEGGPGAQGGSRGSGGARIRVITLLWVRVCVRGCVRGCVGGVRTVSACPDLIPTTCALLTSSCIQFVI